jgi:hypothetical protein
LIEKYSIPAIRDTKHSATRLKSQRDSEIVGHVQYATLSIS